MWAGAGASVGGMGLQLVLLRRGKAAVVSSWAYAVPVCAAIEGCAVLDERLGQAQVAGSATVLAALWLVNRRGRPDLPLTPPGESPRG